MEDHNTKKILDAIENLAISTQEQFALIDKRSVAMDSRMDSLEKRIELLDNNNQAGNMAMNMKVSKLLTQIDKISERVGAIEEQA